jgi:hypothetical protein
VILPVKVVLASPYPLDRSGRRTRPDTEGDLTAAGNSRLLQFERSNGGNNLGEVLPAPGWYRKQVERPMKIGYKRYAAESK